MSLLRGTLVLAVFLSCTTAGSAQHYHGADPAPKPLHPDSVPLWPGLRDHVSHRITTDSPRAQDYFNQGLALIYGFNHLEAVLSFQRAYRIDPRCAMCYWGEAVALGPNINQEMDTVRWRQAAGAIQRAQSLLPGRTTEMEKSYVSAAAARYLPLPDFRSLSPARIRSIRARMDSLYANAMAGAWSRAKQEGRRDLDAGVFAAEARMDLSPWDQWDLDGLPKPGTAEVLQILRDVLREQADHVGAAHLWIHALEGSQAPNEAEWHADTLSSLMRGSGHIAHMPSHIYHRLGRYADGVRHNDGAVALDSAYLAFRGMTGRYPMYWAHNHDFLWVSANFGGMRGRAMAAAEALERIADDSLAGRFYNAQHFLTARMLVHVRFGEWARARALPRPRYSYPRGIWHFGQGMAALREGRADAAWMYLDSLKRIAAGPAADSTIMGNPAGRLLSIAAGILEGEIRSASDPRDSLAVAVLTRAVAMQDSLRYDEPPPFPYAARHSLGAVLLAAGRPQEATKVYLCDLGRWIDVCEPEFDSRGPWPQRVNRENPWSLMGMAQVTLSLGGNPEPYLADFRRHWGDAPVPPGSRW